MSAADLAVIAWVWLAGAAGWALRCPAGLGACALAGAAVTAAMVATNRDERTNR